MRVTAEIDGDVILTQVRKGLTELRVRDYVLIDGLVCRVTGYQRSAYAITPSTGGRSFNWRFLLTNDRELFHLDDDDEPIVDVIEVMIQ